MVSPESSVSLIDKGDLAPCLVYSVTNGTHFSFFEVAQHFVILPGRRGTLVTPRRHLGGCQVAFAR